MNKSIFQQSLFPLEKSDFSAVDFEKMLQSLGLVEYIRAGIYNGFREMQSVFSDGRKSARLRSDYIHESMFECVQSEIESSPVALDVRFSKNVTGNERLFFECGGYIFIFCLTGAGFNHTKQSEAIRAQRSDKHIITVAYTLDGLRENIQSISLQYRKSGQVLYSYSVPLNVDVLTCEHDTPEVKTVKPRLVRIAKDVSNE